MQDKPGNTKSLGDQGIPRQFHGKFELTLARGETVFGSSPGLRFCIQDHAAAQLHIVTIANISCSTLLPLWYGSITHSHNSVLPRSASCAIRLPKLCSTLTPIVYGGLAICFGDPLSITLASSSRLLPSPHRACRRRDPTTIAVVVGHRHPYSPSSSGRRHWSPSWLGTVDGVVIGSAIVGRGRGHGRDGDQGHWSLANVIVGGQYDRGCSRGRSRSRGQGGSSW